MSHTPLHERNDRTRKIKPLPQRTSQNRLKVFKFKKLKGKRIGSRAKKIRYENQTGSNNDLQIRVKDPDNLPKTSDPQITSVLREMSGVRSKLNRQIAGPFIRRIEAVSKRKQDGTLLARDKKALRNLLERLSSKSLEEQIQNLRSGVSKATLRSLRETTKDLKDLGISVDNKRSSMDRRLKQIVKDSEKNIRQAVKALQQAHSRLLSHGDEIIDSTLEQYNRRKTRFKRRVVDTRDNNLVDGGSLSRAIERIRRTEYQRAHLKASRLMMQEHGITYAYWRLSSNHKSYGGREVCEIFASSTGTKAKKSSLDKTGLYHLDEFPEIPHPNCMCQMEPAG
jgi:hypothetical protein